MSTVTSEVQIADIFIAHSLTRERDKLTLNLFYCILLIVSAAVL